MPVVIGAIVVIGVIAVVAVALGGDDDDGGVPQTSAVQVEGEALPSFEGDTASDPAVGMAAPELSGRDYAGDPVQITDDGNAKALVFVAHWCPHCRAEVPRIADYLESEGLPEGVDMYFVPTSTDSSLPNYPPSEWLVDEDVSSVPTLVDDDDNNAHNAYGNGNFPYLVLVGKDNTVAARISGELPDGSYPSIMNALAAGQPIQVGGDGSSETPE
jgi:thiol-disulfide isomerase/thioredoxin